MKPLLEIDYTGEKFPTSEDRRQFGYEPSGAWIEGPGRSNYYYGKGLDGITASLENSFLVFQYFLKEGRQGSGEKMNGIPFYQEEEVPVEVTPNKAWWEETGDIVTLLEPLDISRWYLRIPDEVRASIQYLERAGELGVVLGDETAVSFDISDRQAYIYSGGKDDRTRSGRGDVERLLEGEWEIETV